MENICSKWNELYSKALPENLKRIREVPGIVVGFHSVIDGLKRVTGPMLEKLLTEDETLLAQVMKRGDELPPEVNSPVDLVTALLSSMKRGKALQLMIRNQETADWVMDKFGYDTIRMGGTSGNMANSLGPMPFKRILAYANPLTREQAELFVDEPNINVLTDEFDLKPPRHAWQGEGIFALHWIFEYQAGESVKVPGLSFTTPRANRFIAAWNPVNNKLQIKPSFKEGLMKRADEFSHLIVSGFHILSENYPDGTVWSDYLIPVADYLRELKAKKPKLKLHYEFASIASSKIRKGIVDHILPNMNSLGLNEVELVAILRDIGEVQMASDIETKDSIEAVFAGLKKLMDISDIDRIQLHDLGYYLTLVKKQYADGETTLKGLLMAGTLAASRCLLGRIGDDSEIAQGLDEPLSEKGLAKIEALAEALNLPELAEKGYSEADGLVISMAPTKVVAEPVLTVGLGDIISSSAFILGSAF